MFMFVVARNVFCGCDVLTMIESNGTCTSYFFYLGYHQFLVTLIAFYAQKMVYEGIPTSLNSIP